MTKTDIIRTIFGESARANKIEAKKGKISLEYLKMCLLFFDGQAEEKKETAKDFIFALLMR